MSKYYIKKLLTKDRGATKETKGYYKYTDSKLARFERLLVNNPQNIQKYNRFKKAVQNKELVGVSSTFYYSYVGVVLSNNMVINFAKDTILEIGDIVYTEKGKLGFIRTPAGYRQIRDKNVDEDLNAITESIYDLQNDDIVETLLYGDISFECVTGETKCPRIVVSLPNVRMKDEYSDYFRFITTRRKLLERMDSQLSGGLNTVVALDESLPCKYREEFSDMTPEERVYRYICRNPLYLYEFKKSRSE